MKTIYKLLFFSGLIIANFHANATHIMGGDLTYKHIKDSTYELRFLVYRDCNSGQADIDNSITYWVYYKKTKKIFLTNKTVKLFGSKKKVKPEAPNCVTPTGVCIESGEYVDTITLGGDPDGYIITWYRHERNLAITNLRRCTSTSDNNNCNSTTFCSSTRNPFGMVWTAEIPSYKYKNNSPQFLTVPVPFFCTGKVNSFNHVVYDPDGDSLYFDIVTPLSPEQCLPAAPSPTPSNPPEDYSTIYKQVVYQTGYSSSKPFGSTSSTISIDATTGEMKAQPSSAGNYVIAIRIREYRVDPVTKKVTFLGSIRRDLQFIAGSCPSNNPPTYSKTGSSSYNVDPGDTLTFDIEGKDDQDTVYLKATGSIFGGASSIPKPYATFPAAKGYKLVKQSFFWIPTCEHITYSSPHIIAINLSDQGCNSIQRTYSITVNTRPIYKAPAITCLDILSNSSIKLTWKAPSSMDFFKTMQLYRVNSAGVATQVAQFTSKSTSSYTDNSVSNAQSSVYYYYLRVTNSCDLEGVKGDSLATVHPVYTELNSNSIKLDWNAFSQTKFYKYTVQKQVGASYSNVLTTFDKTATINGCGLNTNFRILMTDTTTGSSCSVLSQVVKSNTGDNTGPPAPKITNASVLKHSSVQVDFTKSSGTDTKSYALLKSLNGGAYKQIATIAASATLKFTDNSAAADVNNLCYKVVALDSCDNYGDSSAAHCPVNLSGRSGQLSSILKWAPYKGYTIKNVDVQRYDTVGKKWTTLATVSSGTTTYTDSKNTVCNSRYFYRLISHDNGSSASSLSDSVVVIVKDTVPPNNVDILSGSNVDDTTSTIRFLKVTDKDVDRYVVIWLEYNKGNFTNTGLETYVKNNTDTLSFNFKTPKSNARQYCYRLFAVDTCSQNFSPSSELHCAVYAEATPQNRQVKLDWTPYSGFSVKNYDVQRFDKSAWVTIATQTSSATSYTDKLLPCNVTQQYRIKVNENRTKGEVSYSNIVFATPFDTVKPKTPAITRVTVLTNTSNEIIWNKTPDTDVHNYQISASINGGAYSVIDTVKHFNSKSLYRYVHKGIDAKNNTYKYKVIAFDTCASNASVNNKPHQGIKLNGQAGNLETNISWTSYEGFPVTGYNVQVQDKSTKKWSDLVSLSSTTTSYNHQGVNCIDTIVYRIRAFENIGSNADTTISDTIRIKPYDTISPEPPIIKSITVASANRITLEWKASSSPDADRYVVYRRKSGTTAYAPIDTLLRKFTYQDRISTDTIWEYAIKAIDSCADNLSFNYAKKVNNLLLLGKSSNCSGLITLNWNSYLNFENGVKEYQILRSTDGKSEVQIATVNGSTLTYADATVTQYHNYSYRIKAVETSSSNISYSQILDIKSFQTPVPEIMSVSKTATDISKGEVTITWVSQVGRPLVEKMRLYFRKGSTGAFSILQDNIPLSTTDFVHKNLNTKTEDYSYFLVNIDSCNNISDTMSIHKTMDMTFVIGQLAHSLSWTAYEGFTIDRYVLQKLISGVFVDLDTIDPGKSSYYKFPAPCNAAITYRMAAYSNKGFMAVSDTASGVAIDTLPPDAPFISNITVVKDTYVQIDFKGADSLDIYGYAILRSRDGKHFSSRGTVPFSSPKQTATFNDTAFVDNYQYCYAVVSLDSCLNATSSDTFCTIHLVGQPGNFENKVQWDKFQGYALTQYDVEVNDGTGFISIVNLSPTDSNYIHSDIGCNKPLDYRVMGRRGSLRTFSNVITLTPFDTIAPDKPVFAYASINDKSQIEIKWEYDSGTDVKYFDLYRSDSSGKFTLLSQLTFADQYIDLNVFPDNVIYNYYVVATDSCNASHISPASDTNTTFIIQYAIDTCDPTTYLSWTSYAGLKSGVEKYVIYRKLSSVKNWKVLDSVDGTKNAYRDTTVLPLTEYCYRIEAVNNTTGYKAFADTICLKQKLLPTTRPPVFTLTSVKNTGILDGEVEFNWQKISYKEEEHLGGYRIYRADTVGLPYKLVADLNSRDDISTILTVDTKEEYNYYRMTSYNTCGVDGDTSILHSPIQLHVQNLNLASELKWTAYFGFEIEEYEIYSSVAASPFTKIATVPGSQFKYTDLSVGCGDSIVFLIKGKGVNGLETYSDIEHVIGFDTAFPEPVTLKSVSTINNGKNFKIEWNPSTSSDTKYYIVNARRRGQTDWDTLTKVATSTLYNDLTLKPDDNEPFEFEVTPIDECGNVQPEYSPFHQSIAAKAQKDGSSVNLKWINYRGWPVKEFNIYKDAKLLITIPITNAKFDSVFSLTDSSFNCDSTIYEYNVEAISAFGDISISNFDTAFGYDASPPKAIYLQSASVSTPNNEISLEWNQSFETDLNRYRISRFMGNTEDKIENIGFADKSETTYLDKFNITDSYPCYIVEVEDNCGNIGLPSNHACVILLTGGNVKLANSLRWNPYQQWPDSVSEYYLYRSKDSIHWETLNTFSNKIFTYVDTNLRNDEITYFYKLKAVETFGSYNAESWSTTIKINQEPIVYMPNAFTPTFTPGINDYFGPFGVFIPEDYHMEIFGRWGQVVFSTDRGELWDGLINGQLAPIGEYSYIITMKSRNGSDYKYTGSVLVLY